MKMLKIRRANDKLKKKLSYSLYKEQKYPNKKQQMMKSE